MQTELFQSRPKGISNQNWLLSRSRVNLSRSRRFSTLTGGLPPNGTSSFGVALRDLASHGRPILLKYKFTNAYRVLDRTSQYLIGEVIRKGDRSPMEMFYRILLFMKYAKATGISVEAIGVCVHSMRATAATNALQTRRTLPRCRSGWGMLTFRLPGYMTGARRGPNAARRFTRQVLASPDSLS
jgi:alpha-glutamyl/putrescinyl thymine pyrophosphorylase clade 1